MLSKQLAKRGFANHSQVKPRVTQLLIDGKFVNSSSGKTFDTFNPATEEKIASVQEASVEDVNKNYEHANQQSCSKLFKIVQNCSKLLKMNMPINTAAASYLLLFSVALILHCVVVNFVVSFVASLRVHNYLCLFAVF